MAPRSVVALGSSLALGLVIAVGAGAYVAGRAQASRATWHTGQAYVGLHVATVRTGGWTYGFRDAVPQWIDQRGSTHEGGWPACLDVPAGTQMRIRFAAVDVKAGGTGWRQVVMLDCRPA